MRPTNRPATGITPNSTAGHMLQALRAGPMTSGELAERFVAYSSVTAALVQQGLVTKPRTDGGYWTLTAAGRAACPYRNPLAAPLSHKPPVSTGAHP